VGDGGGPRKGGAGSSWIMKREIKTLYPFGGGSGGGLDWRLGNDERMMPEGDRKLKGRGREKRDEGV